MKRKTIGYERQRNKDLRENRVKEWVRSMQTALWVGLILAEMAAVNRLETRAEHRTVMQETDDITVQSAPEVVEYEKRRVEKEVTYHDMEGSVSFPETIQVEIMDGGRTATANCEKQECRILNEHWDDDFQFPLTFHTYDADYYLCGERMVPHTEGEPDMEGCKGDLLDMIGVSPDEYRIDTVTWKGEPYEDESGSLCRDAVAWGSRLMRDYEVRYVGTAWFPVQEDSLLPDLEEPEEEDTREEIPDAAVQEESRAEEEPLQPEIEPVSLWQKMTKTLLVIVGIGALLFLGGLLLLLAVRVEKKLRSWYTERKSKSKGETTDVYRE